MHKTELLLITVGHIPLQVDMSIGNEVIRTKRARLVHMSNEIRNMDLDDNNDV